MTFRGTGPTDKQTAPTAACTGVENQKSKGLLVTKQAARYLNYAPQTLANWRVAGIGPKWAQGSPKGKVLYPIEELDGWLDANMRKSTSDQGGGNVR